MDSVIKIDLSTNRDVCQNMKDDMFRAGFSVSLLTASDVLRSMSECVTKSYVVADNQGGKIYVEILDRGNENDRINTVGRICSTATLEFNRAFSAFAQGLFLHDEEKCVNNTDTILFAKQGAIFIPNIITEGVNNN